jgi:hypothetical protein
MPLQASFTRSTLLRGVQAFRARSARVAPQLQKQRPAAENTNTAAFLFWAVLVALTVGLITLRAAIWLPLSAM